MNVKSILQDQMNNIGIASSGGPVNYLSDLI